MSQSLRRLSPAPPASASASAPRRNPANPPADNATSSRSSRVAAGRPGSGGTSISISSSQQQHQQPQPQATRTTPHIQPSQHSQHSQQASSSYGNLAPAQSQPRSGSSSVASGTGSGSGSGSLHLGHNLNLNNLNLDLKIDHAARPPAPHHPSSSHQPSSTGAPSSTLHTHNHNRNRTKELKERPIAAGTTTGAPTDTASHRTANSLKHTRTASDNLPFGLSNSNSASSSSAATKPSFHSTQSSYAPHTQPQQHPSTQRPHNPSSSTHPYGSTAPTVGGPSTIDHDRQNNNNKQHTDNNRMSAQTAAAVNGSAPSTAKAGASSSKAAATTKGSLQCQYPDCGKAFSRKDHLVRHAANHAQPNYHCSTCGRSFQRLDLLQRHERRNICDDERYPKRLKSRAHQTTATAGAAQLKQSQPQDHATGSSAPSLSQSQPHSRPQSQPQSRVGSSQPPPAQHRPQSQHGQPTQTHGTPDSAGHSTVSGNGPLMNRALASTTTSQTDSPNDFPNQMFPVLDLLDVSSGMAGHGSGAPNSAMGADSQNGRGSNNSITPVSGVPNMNDLSTSGHFIDIDPNTVASAPICFEPIGYDFGFGAGPPHPWEALLNDALAPVFWDERTIHDAQPWEQLLQQSTTRTQESAERALANDVNVPLLQRLLAAYPDLNMTVQDLNESISLYWSKVAPTFPFIHRGTFNTELATPELLVMMAVSGAVHRKDVPRRDDRALTRRVRSRLVEDRFGLEVELATLQTYTLCHIYDVWYGDTETLFTAQCMWPVVVAHSRMQGIGAIGAQTPSDHPHHGSDAWLNWAKDEERRRAAYCILYLDTQIGTFWSQHPSRQLSIFAHNINLPAPRSQWEAMSATEWLRARENDPSSRHSSRHHYSLTHGEFNHHQGAHHQPGDGGYSPAILQALSVDNTQGGQQAFKVDLDNSFSVMMILAGLSAIAWDSRTRGGMGIKFRDGTKHWRNIILKAVVALRASYEMAVNGLPQCNETRDIRDWIAISIIQILSDLPMLQVAAGSTTVCGTAIGPKQYADARRRLKLWVATGDSWTCLWQSARYLRETLQAEWGLYTPWAVFLTTLVVWGCGQAMLRDDEELPPPSENPESGARQLLDSIFNSPNRVKLDRGVLDLCVVAASRLENNGSQHTIDRDCAQLLWRLAKVKR